VDRRLGGDPSRFRLDEAVLIRAAALGYCVSVKVKGRRYFARPDLFRDVQRAGFDLRYREDRKVASDWLEERGQDELAKRLRSVGDMIAREEGKSRTQ
jgi:hypothetical protein